MMFFNFCQWYFKNFLKQVYKKFLAWYNGTKHIWRCATTMDSQEHVIPGEITFEFQANDLYKKFTDSSSVIGNRFNSVLESNKELVEDMVLKMAKESIDAVIYPTVREELREYFNQECLIQNVKINYASNLFRLALTRWLSTSLSLDSILFRITNTESFKILLKSYAQYIKDTIREKTEKFEAEEASGSFKAHLNKRDKTYLN